MVKFPSLSAPSYYIFGTTLTELIRINTWCVDNGYSLIAIGQHDVNSDAYFVRAATENDAGNTIIVDLTLRLHETTIELVAKQSTS